MRTSYSTCSFLPLNDILLVLSILLVSEQTVLKMWEGNTRYPWV